MAEGKSEKGPEDFAHMSFAQIVVAMGTHHIYGIIRNPGETDDQLAERVAQKQAEELTRLKTALDPPAIMQHPDETDAEYIARWKAHLGIKEKLNDHGE